MAAERWLLIETSGSDGLVGLGDGDAVISEKRLDATRRHARDLAPAMKDLLVAAGWQPGQLHGIAVSQGPGSYTGLRVGIMAARAMTYALGCRLVAVPTFAVIAEQTDSVLNSVHIIADALKGKLYEQQFAREAADAPWSSTSSLRIVERARWLSELRDSAISGPGVDLVERALPPGVSAVEHQRRIPGLAALLRLARRTAPSASALESVEPLYLRASSAEEQWTGP